MGAFAKELSKFISYYQIELAVVIAILINLSRQPECKDFEQNAAYTLSNRGLVSLRSLYPPLMNRPIPPLNVSLVAEDRFLLPISTCYNLN